MIRELDDRELPASSLQIEVTETVFLGRGATYVEEALKMLNANGVRVALDDFGTGYASLSHLNQFPVDILKIDRSFIAQIGESGEADAIAAAIINLGHCLGMEIVGEGVESSDQEAQLLELGCDRAQGFLYSAALPAKSVPAFLQHWEPPALAAVV